MVKLQKWIRGFVVRTRNERLIRQFKHNALRKGKGYVMATRIQSHIRGFLFRNKRKRALAKLAGPRLEEVKDDFDYGDDDLDADAFLGVKMEHLEANDDIMAGATDELMEKFI